MSKYAVINLKLDPDLKKRAAETADRLGISLSAVLNNELRRFTAEQAVVFEVPEVPNMQTSEQLRQSRQLIDKGEVHRFADNERALAFLADELK